jgi:protein lifeguard
MDREEYVESDVSTREAIDAFLTRDSRNSFIGESFGMGPSRSSLSARRQFSDTKNLPTHTHDTPTARVYSILSVQLIITAISCFLFGLNPVLSNISQLSRNGEPSPWAAIPLVGIVTSTLAWFRVCSSPEARRTAPQKWWWLGLFTAGEALSVGFITSFYKFRVVVTAMGATAAATLAVSLYTIRQNNPKRDLSQMGASLSSASMILLTYLMIGMLQKSGVFPHGFQLVPFSDLLYSGVAACLFSAYLAYHTKLIVAGKHAKYRMNDQDYVFGAMALYTDVVGIFLNLLEILGSKEQDRRR